MAIKSLRSGGAAAVAHGALKSEKVPYLGDDVHLHNFYLNIKMSFSMIQVRSP